MSDIDYTTTHEIDFVCSLASKGTKEARARKLEMYLKTMPQRSKWGNVDSEKVREYTVGLLSLYKTIETTR